MSQIWVPPNIAAVCPEQLAPLTQCSQLGYMYLTLLTQLFGKSIDSVHRNPYFDPSAVQSGFTGSEEIETSITGPSYLGPTQLPQSQTSLSQSQVTLGQNQIPFGQSQIPLGSTASPFSQSHSFSGFVSQNRGPFGVPEQSFQGLSGLSSGVTYPYSGTQAPFGQYQSQTPIKPHSIESATTGLGPVLHTDFSINHSTKTRSYGPKGSRAFSEASFYLKPQLGKSNEARLQKEYDRPSDFKFESSFGEYSSPLFDFENVRRVFDDIDTAATDTKVEERKLPATKEKKKTKKSRKRRQAIEEYDFIVVGAGSAGCVVANRLSEVKKWKVLLLEAGPEEPEVTSVPGLAPVLGRSSIDWNYRTQPEELTCRAQRGQTCAWFSGKVMGGSSSINYLVYMRGNKRDYNDWADLGNYGWSYREVLTYFKKSENNQNIEAKNTEYHGIDGPMNIVRFNFIDRNIAMLVNALNQTGLPLVDFNGENQIGTMTVQTTSKNGQRMSTNVAFIKPIRYKRKNLVIVTNARVTRVLIEPKKKLAYGVKYFKDGVWYEVHALKEVILSAGAIGTPKILMLSGVGPKDDLEALNIPVIKNLNVGKNLHDHATTNAMLMKLSNKTSTLIQANKILNEIQKYSSSNRNDGPLSATGPLQMTAFTRTKYADEDESVPDIQFHFDGRNFREFYSDPTTYLETNILPLSFYDSISVRPILLLPKSRGCLTLNTTDPIFGLPLIYPQFFTIKRDLDTLVEALKFIIKLEDTEAFKNNGVKFIRKPVEACKHFKWGTYKYFACLFTSYTGTIYHPAGTCKMGPRQDKEAVVNPKLKVHGIKRLRVADASIMPNIVRGNTNAPVIMIGEKVSDMIKEYWIHYL